jgi:hypothetical protein
METLQSLLSIATEAIFTFTAGMGRRFLRFPFQPYLFVVKTSRLLRDYHLSTVALVAFSFLLLALSLGRPGNPILSFSGGFGDGLGNIWTVDKRQVEVLYLGLFMLGSTVLTIWFGRWFSRLLEITNDNRKLFMDVYNVFVSFTVLWFVFLAITSAYILQLFGVTVLPQALPFQAALKYLLQKAGFSDVSEMLVSPAFYVILFMSGYFGSRMVRSWSLRREIRKVVKGKALRQSAVALGAAIAAFAVIVIPALYLALLSASLFKRAAPHPDFDFFASCYSSGSKVHVMLIVQNNTGKNAALQPLYIVFSGGKTALKIQPTDIFWMSTKGLYLDPGEMRYYRLEAGATAQFSDVENCEAKQAKDMQPAKTSIISAKIMGDAHSVTGSSNDMK